MKQRAISAVFFVILLLGGIFGSDTTFFILFALITAGSLWELMGLLFRQEANYLLLRKISGTVLGSLPFLGSGFYWLQTSNGVQLSPGSALPVFAACLLLVSLLFIAELFLQSPRPFANIGNYLLGLAYVGLPLALLLPVAFGQGYYAPWRVFGLLLLIWTNDTMAYLIGSRIGKRPFFARISPKKTWEGTLGGAVCTILMAFLLPRWIADYDPREWLLLACCVGIFGTLGDLVESMLKRSLDIKDSGSIMPGHGGFLDRFDSFIFVLPFAWLILVLGG